MMPDVNDDLRRKIALDPPRYRGVLHTWCIPIALVAGVAAIVSATGTQARLLVGVYAVCAVAMFTFSALFHRIRWSDQGWWRMRQLDHTGIYLMIAGSFTSIAGLSLVSGPDESKGWLLLVVWLVTAVGIGFRWLPLVPPFGLMTVLYIALASLAVPVLGDLARVLGGGGTALLLVGCGIYLVGALALGARFPDPWPRVFGYHEVWHVLVVIGAALHYIVVVGYAIPAATQ